MLYGWQHSIAEVHTLSRRNFLTQASLTSGASIAFTGRLLASQPAAPITYASVHKSASTILLQHIKKMQAKPSYNPFASGELATAYRMHCDALESSGINAAIEAHNNANGPAVLTASSLQQVYDRLQQAGNPMSVQYQQLLTSKLLETSPLVAPRVHKALQSVTRLHMQKATYFTMILPQKKAAEENTLAAMRAFGRHRLESAAFHIPAHIYAIPGEDGSDDSQDWAGEDSVSLDGSGTEDEIYLGGDASGYISDYSISVWSDGYTTPSGQEIQWCTIYNTLLSLAAGGLAAVMGYIAAQGGAGIPALTAIGLDPPALAARLAILAAYWAACAVFC